MKSYPSFSQRLSELYAEMRATSGLSDIARIAVALYDPVTDRLRTYADCSEVKGTLEHYSCRLTDVPSLAAMVGGNVPKIVDDTLDWADSPSHHARRLLADGYRSSYAMALEHGSELMGFVFVNSFRPAYFGPAVAERLRPYAKLVTMMLVLEMERLHVLSAAVDTVREIGSYRDDLAGRHLLRMANYARAIAERLAPRYGLSEEWVEHLARFAPLHDIGELAVPETILYKPSKLTEEEFEVMKSHVTAGQRIVSTLVRNFGLEGMGHVALLENLVACHHEGLDGTGYPRGLEGEDLPLEARIITVADVFDALTSPRPYREVWSNDQAYAHLRAMAGRQFDADCVDALIDARAEVETIQARFSLD